MPGATIFTAPRQNSHVSISILNTRLRRRAWLMARCFSGSVVFFAGLNRLPRPTGVILIAPATVGCEDSVESCEVNAWTGRQCRQPGYDQSAGLPISTTRGRPQTSDTIGFQRIRILNSCHAMSMPVLAATKPMLDDRSNLT